MNEQLIFLESEEIVKVVVQNDIFDVFTARKICFRFDLATAKLLREISFDDTEVGDILTDIKYFEAQDTYLIQSSENFILGDFVYGFRMIEAVISAMDIKDDSLAFVTKEGLELYAYPDLTAGKSLALKGIHDICFINEDRELFIVTEDGNFLLELNMMALKSLLQLQDYYKELRYKDDFIIGIKKDCIDFIEEDTLEVSTDYAQMSIPNETVTAVKLCDDEVYVILGGSLGGVEIFNVETNTLFYKGKMADGCAIETIHMDMEYQLVLIYTKEKGIEMHPFVDFI